MMSLVAARDGEIVGCGAIASDPLSWSAHVGELRVLIGAQARGRGVGRKLTQRLFALALEAGLQRIVAQMTVDQTAAISVFEGLGFRAEAMLKGHVRDRAGKRHDIVILGHEVADVLARLEALGVVDATRVLDIHRNLYLETRVLSHRAVLPPRAGKGSPSRASSARLRRERRP